MLQKSLFGDQDRKPKVFIGQGWSCMLESLKGIGRIWLITPWLTSNHQELLDIVKEGDRLVIRGNIQDFINGSSNIDIISKFLDKGMEIKLLKNLHAKIYLREGFDSVLWMGSANLTNAGFEGSEYSRFNIEAMAGAFNLDEDSLNAIHRLWQAAENINIEKIYSEIRKYKNTETNLFLENSEDRILAIRMRFQGLSGFCTIKPEWLGIDITQAPWSEVTFPQLPYISKSQKIYKDIEIFNRRNKKEIRSDIMQPILEDFSGMYIFYEKNKNTILSKIQDVQNRIIFEFKNRLEKESDDLKKDFARRFKIAYSGFRELKAINDMPFIPEVDEILKIALGEFDFFIQKKILKIHFDFFIPMIEYDNNASPLTQAATILRLKTTTLYFNLPPLI